MTDGCRLWGETQGAGGPRRGVCSSNTSGAEAARASARVFAWGRRAPDHFLQGVNGGSTPMPKHRIPGKRCIQPTVCSHSHRRGARYPGSRAVHLALPGRSPVPARALPRPKVIQQPKPRHSGWCRFSPLRKSATGPNPGGYMAIFFLHGLQQPRQLALVAGLGRPPQPQSVGCPHPLPAARCSNAGSRPGWWA